MRVYSRVNSGLGCFWLEFFFSKFSIYTLLVNNFLGSPFLVVQNVLHFVRFVFPTLWKISHAMGNTKTALGKGAHTHTHAHQTACGSKIKINASEECAVVSTLYNYVSLRG